MTPQGGDPCALQVVNLDVAWTGASFFPFSLLRPLWLSKGVMHTCRCSFWTKKLQYFQANESNEKLQLRHIISGWDVGALLSCCPLAVHLFLCLVLRGECIFWNWLAHNKLLFSAGSGGGVSAAACLPCLPSQCILHTAFN